MQKSESALYKRNPHRINVLHSSSLKMFCIIYMIYGPFLMLSIKHLNIYFIARQRRNCIHFHYTRKLVSIFCVFMRESACTQACTCGSDLKIAEIKALSFLCHKPHVQHIRPGIHTSKHTYCFVKMITTVFPLSVLSYLISIFYALNSLSH